MDQSHGLDWPWQIPSILRDGPEEWGAGVMDGAEMGNGLMRWE